MEFSVGDFRQGEILLEEHTSNARKLPSGPTLEHATGAIAIVIAGRISGMKDRFDFARESAARALSSPIITPAVEHVANTALALIAVEQRDASAARNPYTFLKRWRDSVPFFFTGTDRGLGFLAQTMGEFDQAIAHFEDALAFCRGAGHRSELPWTCCDYADVLRERDGQGDRGKAMSLLDESLKISRELGMRPLMERVLSRREILRA